MCNSEGKRKCVFLFLKFSLSVQSRNLLLSFCFTAVVLFKFRNSTFNYSMTFLLFSSHSFSLSCSHSVTQTVLSLLNSYLYLFYNTEICLNMCQHLDTTCCDFENLLASKQKSRNGKLKREDWLKRPTSAATVGRSTNTNLAKPTENIETKSEPQQLQNRCLEQIL